jgi:hypothetical protein
MIQENPTKALRATAKSRRALCLALEANGGISNEVRR